MKNNLDEMQEQKLLHIERFGFWFAFCGLLIAIVVQIIIGADFNQLAGEWIVFMLLCIITFVGCIKNGIWDRRLKPNLKTNLIFSIIAGLVFGLIYGISNYLHFKGHLKGHIIYGVIYVFIFALIIFALCFTALQISARVYKKRVQKLEDKLND